MSFKKAVGEGKNGFLVFDEIKMLFRSHRQEALRLSRISEQLLIYMFNNNDRIITLEELGRNAGFKSIKGGGPFDDTVQKAVRRLRQDLRERYEFNPDLYIHIVYGVGIRFIARIEHMSFEDHQAWLQSSPKIAMQVAGPERHRVFTQPPTAPSDALEFAHVDKLRGWIEDRRYTALGTIGALPNPIEVSVAFGMFFACGLMKPGWWTKARGQLRPTQTWRSGVQQWRFHGFDEWGPSLDFSWDLSNSSAPEERHHFFGQFGDGDEADSIPVYMGRDAAMALLDDLESWGGMPSSIRCLLGHRSHFPALDPAPDHADGAFMSIFVPKSGNHAPDARDLMSWCLWIAPDNARHGVRKLTTAQVQNNTTLSSPGHDNIYSGYIWKCFAPKTWYDRGSLKADEIFFIWQHTNFANVEALDYDKTMLEHEERLMRRHITAKTGETQIVELAKSSNILRGAPKWRQDELNIIFDDIRRAIGHGKDGD